MSVLVYRACGGEGNAMEQDAGGDTIGSSNNQMTPLDAGMPLCSVDHGNAVDQRRPSTKSREFIMNAKSKFVIAGLVLGAAMASGTVFAQTDVPNHPRVNEVNNRLENQQDRIQNGLKNGTMTQKQAARDEAHDANIARRESVDEAKHNGHLTKQEQRNLNRAENHNSKHIYKQKH